MKISELQNKIKENAEAKEALRIILRRTGEEEQRRRNKTTQKSTSDATNEATQE